ncbi:hypothetical protein ACWIUD_09350 [Helicobacter sp. 23-1044]
MTEKRQILDSANQTKNAESNTKITHPLNPPPQGRGNFLDSAKRTKCCRILMQFRRILARKSQNLNAKIAKIIRFIFRIF